MLYDDRDDTCATVLKTLEMSMVDVYMVTTTHLHKGDCLKPPEHTYIHEAIANMRKHDIFPILQMG